MGPIPIYDSITVEAEHRRHSPLQQIFRRAIKARPPSSRGVMPPSKIIRRGRSASRSSVKRPHGTVRQTRRKSASVGSKSSKSASVGQTRSKRIMGGVPRMTSSFDKESSGGPSYSKPGINKSPLHADSHSQSQLSEAELSLANTATSKEGSSFDDSVVPNNTARFQRG